MQRATLVTLAATAAIAAAFFTGSTVANSTRLAPVPPTVATVNIQTIFDQMSERKDKLVLLQNEANKLEDEFKILNASINRDRENAARMPEGPQKDIEIEKVVDRDVQANIDIKKAKARLEKAQADTIRSIFAKIQAEVSTTAAADWREPLDEIRERLSNQRCFPRGIDALKGRDPRRDPYFARKRGQLAPLATKR